MGPVRPRAAAAVLALATTPIGAFIALEVQLAVITAFLVLLLVLEQRPAGAAFHDRGDFFRHSNQNQPRS